MKRPVLAPSGGAVATGNGVGEEEVLRLDVSMDDVQLLENSQSTSYRQNNQARFNDKNTVCV